MKYSTQINLAGIDHYGLSDCTDLDDWLILDYIHDWSRSLGACRRGDYVWLNFKTALDQMPILRVKTKSGLSNRIKKLTALGLIVTRQDDEDKRLFVKLTELFLEVVWHREDGKRGVHLNEQGVHSDEHSLSNKYNMSTSTEDGGTENVFSMTMDWKPDEILYKSILKKAGFSPGQVDRIWEADFVTHWWAHPDRQLTHEAWTWRLGLKIVDYLRDPNLFDRLRGIYAQDQ